MRPDVLSQDFEDEGHVRSRARLDFGKREQGRNAVHIVVALRLVPDLSGDIELTPDGADLDREWLDLKLNEFDDHALEEAILLQEQFGAKVTAVAMDSEGIDRALQTALSRGADEAFKIWVDGGAELSSRAVAPVFGAALRELGAELFFTGVQTPEDIFGQLAPMVAARLDWPCLSAVSSVRPEAAHVLVQQEHSGGLSTTFRVSTPAAIGVQTASRPIRYVSGSKLRQFAGTKIPTLTVSDNIFSPHATRLSLQQPDRNCSAKMLDGDADSVAAQLRTLLIERGLMKEFGA
jgi:electron transfer flavoprotein beta subunit